MSTSTILPIIHPVEGDLHVESLAGLRSAIVDIVDEVDQLRGQADAAAAPVLGAFRELHENHLRDLTAEMVGHGHPPEEAGAIRDLFQAGKARLRDLSIGSSDQMLRRLLDDERDVIGAYTTAMQEGGPAGTIELLNRQREELGGLVAEHEARLG